MSRTELGDELIVEFDEGSAGEEVVGLVTRREGRERTCRAVL